MRILTRLLLLAALVLIMGCTRAVPTKQVEFAIDSNNLEGIMPDNYDAFPVYRVLPGDVLDVLFHFSAAEEDKFILLPQDTIEVNFPDLPDLSASQEIRPDGRISMPYLGDVDVVGLSPRELADKLEVEYSKEILRDPKIHVIVRTFGGKIMELKKSIENAPRGQSKLIFVRNDGFATFPVVGDLQMAGLTLPEAGRLLNDRFLTITKDLRVDLLLHETVGATISVLGAVGTPGSYNITRPLTVIEAITMANGFANDAHFKDVIIMAKDGDKFVSRSVDVNAILSGKPSAKMTYVSQHDIVYVPRTGRSRLAQAMTELYSIISWRGVSASGGYDLGGLDDEGNVTVQQTP